MVLVTVNCFTTYSYTESFHQMWLHKLFSLNTVTKKLFTKNFDKISSKKNFSKKIFFKKIFPKIFFQKVPFWGQRKYHFGASEKYHFGDSEISLALKFMLRIPFSMEIWGSGAAKKSTILGTAKVPFWGQRKVPFWGQRKYHFGDSEKLDLVTKNLFTKHKYIEIVHQKLWKKNYGFGYIKLFHHYWLQRIFSPNMFTMNLFTVQRHLLVWKKNFFLVEMS